jgi:hypothetical protein
LCGIVPTLTITRLFRRPVIRSKLKTRLVESC